VDSTLAIVLGLVALATVVLLGVGWGRSARRAAGSGSVVEQQGPDASSGPTLMRPSRIVVVGDPRSPTGSRAGVASGASGRSGDPRRRQVRDASAVLLVAGLAVVVVANLPAIGGSS